MRRSSKTGRGFCPAERNKRDDQEIGRIYAVADISALSAERAHALRELVLTNGLLTLLIVAFGTLLMRWLLRPVGLLSRYLARGREASMPPITTVWPFLTRTRVEAPRLTGS
mgnify:CR=1 FL=1